MEEEVERVSDESALEKIFGIEFLLKYSAQ